MAGLDSSIIGGANPRAFAEGATDAQTITSNDLTIQKQQTEQTDQSKLTGIMKNLDPNSPTYSRDLFNEASRTGVSAKTLLNLKQNIFTEQGLQLQQQSQRLSMAEQINKMTDNDLKNFQARSDDFAQSFGGLVERYKGLTPEQQKDPTVLGQLKTERDSAFKQHVDDNANSAVADLIAQGKLPANAADADLDTKKQALGQLAQKGDKIAGRWASDAQMWTKASSSPYNAQATEALYDTSSFARATAKATFDKRSDAAKLSKEETDANTEGAVRHADINEKNAKAVEERNKAAGENKQIIQKVVTKPDGTTETHNVEVDKATGKEVSDLGMAAPKTGMGSAMNARFSGRVLGAAKEGGAALDSVSRMGTSGGFFQDAKSGHSLVGSAAEGTAKGILTTEKQKRYNASIAGMSNEIASAQNQGLAPHEGQIQQIREALTIQPTDSAQTAQYRIALGARWLKKALETSRDTANPQQQKDMDEEIKKLDRYPDPDLIADSSPGANLFPDSVGNAKGSTGSGQSQVRTGSQDATPSSGWGTATVVGK